MRVKSLTILFSILAMPQAIAAPVLKSAPAKSLSLFKLGGVRFKPAMPPKAPEPSVGLGLAAVFSF